MTHLALHSVPRTRKVAVAQIRAVAVSLRWFGVALATLVAVATGVVVTEFLRTGETMAFHPEHQMLPGIIGLLLPIGVWMGEQRFGPGLLWTLPVDRRRHALTRVFAGWMWLIVAVAIFTLWQFVLTLLSGGNILGEESLRVLSSTLRGTLDLTQTHMVPWKPQPLLWLVPFSAATGTYLLASAAALGIRHPLRWVVAIVFGLFLVFAIGDAAKVGWLADGVKRVLQTLFEGRYGIDALLTARTESLKIDAPLSTGELIVVWRGLPVLQHWAAATLLWTTVGLATLWAAASRHRERRRA